MNRYRRNGQRGQILVIAAGGMIALILAVGLVIDGGGLFAQQRQAQNGVDASASSGAVKLAERLAGVPVLDFDVAEAVRTTASAYSLESVTGTYTDINGVPLGFDVGRGPIPSGASGVAVSASRPAAAYFSRVFGFTGFTASANATAIAGYLRGVPKGAALPVTFPIAIAICDKNGDIIGDPPYEIGEEPYWPILSPGEATTEANKIAIPLCKLDSGAVGWLDFTDNANLADEVVNGNSEPLSLPAWFHTQPGNPNNVEDVINDNYAGSTVLIPLFDQTCRSKPSGLTILDCPVEDVGVDNSGGNNTWYHIPAFVGLLLDHAYIQDKCPSSVAGTKGGFTSCLTGWFVRYLDAEGPVEMEPGSTANSRALGVQLIK